MSRRLLMAGGGSGAFALPGPSVVTLTTAPDGGTNPWNIAAAYQRSGTSYIAYVDSSGNLEAITYDGVTVGGPYTIAAAFEADVHTGPALCRRTSDGKIVAVYTKHNGTPIDVRISSSADDVSSWGSATSIGGSLGGTRYTDVQLFELSDGTLFLFYRDEPSAGTDSRWCYSRSTDGGATWAAQTQLFKIASTRSYVISWKDPASDLIHFVATNGASTGFTKLGHFRMDGLTLARTKSDASTISASLPLTFTDITTAYTGTTGVQPWNVVVDSSGRPHILVEDIIAGAISYADARWTGSAWSQHTIATAGTGYEYNGSGTGFGSYGGFLDDADPETAWVIRDASGNSEMWRYRTTDSGATWVGLQVSSGSSTTQVSPICVRTPDTTLRGYWQDNVTYTTYTSWSARLRGVSDPAGIVLGGGGGGVTPPVGFYISPSGSDSTGDGSIGNPWRTLGKLYANLGAGDTGYCRGGSYTGNNGDVGVLVTSTGLVASPITVQAYPGETPIFDGTGATIGIQNYAVQWKASSAYHVMSGLTFQNWAWWPGRASNGSGILIFDQTSGAQGAVNHITVEDCTFTSGVATPSLNDWILYVGGAADYITITHNRITGGGTTAPASDYSDFGGGVQMFHDPGARHIVVTNNLIGYCRFGVNIDQPIAEGGTDYTVTHNTFHHNYLHSFAQRGDTILVRDNAGDDPTGSSILDEDSGSGTASYTHDHNYANLTLTGPDYAATGAAIGGAHDGSDAGWTP